MQQQADQRQGRAPGTGASETPFLSDVKTLRERARQHIEAGAVTPSYALDSKIVCNVLNEALATEIVCVLRYKRHYFMAKGIHSESAKAEFLEHANEEQQHADQIAERIVQLGGDADLNPEGLLSRSHSQYDESETIRQMLREDLIAERIAIESYREIAQWLGDKDSTTRKLMEEILATEEEHADDLVSLLEGLPGGINAEEPALTKG
ncbi:MAG TPA: ferritin-like domain-containing protein [Casimicrobiaceae bacterium]|nr:ferritin-like domain-containing protein [Casimicrobiaceae bacterium]